MDYEQVKSYCLSKPKATLDYPFGPDTAVFKVFDKMFATLGTRHGVDQTNLKCDPDHAQALRDLFSGVLPGYHMNKRHWNTVLLDGSVPSGEVARMIDGSFELVVRGLKKCHRDSVFRVI